MTARLKPILFALLLFPYGLCLMSCESEDSENEEPMLIVKFRFDKNQARLNNFGQPASLADGNAAQSPDFNSISAHYLEFASDAYTQLGEGTVVYRAPETDLGGENAIDFSEAKIVSEGETFLKIPLRDVAHGNYNWVRVSLSYQNYTIDVRQAGADYQGTLASFVGFNTYIRSHAIGNNFFDVNANRAQGYWAFALDDYPYSVEGQAPTGATTVPNPMASTSPIPPGSCVVTGKFDAPFSVTGNEDSDVVVTLSLSVNNSFEWQEVEADGKYEPAIGESVIDMGLRGLVPAFERQ